MTQPDRLLARIESVLDRIECALPMAPAEPDWDAALAFRWRHRGPHGHLQAIRHTGSVRLADLQCIDRQKELIVRNTRQFLAGLPANHVLLWGPRGTGKSSLIRALLKDYTGLGLRLIEIGRDQGADLPDLYERLHPRGERFIIYCDDLSFEAADPAYQPLKVALDGSLCAVPDNVLLYATSNRRHLVPEQMSENLETRMRDGDLHPGETTEAKVSLSERFGLWLAFHPFDQEQYLHIVGYWLARFGAVAADPAVLRAEALRWALLHGSRSGRSAWQMARDWAGRCALEGTPS